MIPTFHNLLTLQRIRPHTLKALSQKKVAMLIAQFWQHSVANGSCLEKYFQGMYKVNMLISKLPVELAEITLDLAHHMVNNMNCISPAQSEHLFYLHCFNCKPCNKWQELFRPTSSSKHQELSALASMSNKNKDSAVFDRLKTTDQHDCAKTMLQSGSISLINYITSHIKNVITSNTKTISDTCVSDKNLGEIQNNLSAWHSIITKKKLRFYSSKVISEQHKSIDMKILIELLIKYGVVTYVPSLRDYILKDGLSLLSCITTINSDRTTNYFKNLAMKLINNNDVTTAHIVALLFLLTRKCYRIDEYSIVFSTLYKSFKSHTILATFNQLIRLCWSTQEDFLALKNNLARFALAQHSALSYDSGDLAQLKFFINTINTAIKNQSVEHQLTYFNYAEQFEHDFGDKNNDYTWLFETIADSSYWHILIDLPCLLERTSVSSLSKCIERLHESKHQDSVVQQKINSLHITLKNIIDHRSTNQITTTSYAV